MFSQVLAPLALFSTFKQHRSWRQLHHLLQKLKNHKYNIYNKKYSKTRKFAELPFALQAFCGPKASLRSHIERPSAAGLPQQAWAEHPNFPVRVGLHRAPGHLRGTRPQGQSVDLRQGQLCSHTGHPQGERALQDISLSPVFTTEDIKNTWNCICVVYSWLINSGYPRIRSHHLCHHTWHIFETGLLEIFQI